jgi:hypothetical protein
MLLTNYNVRMANQSRALGGQLNPTKNFDLARMNTYYVGDTSSLAPFVTNVMINPSFELPNERYFDDLPRTTDGNIGGIHTATRPLPYIFGISGTWSAELDSAEKYSGYRSLKLSTTNTLGALAGLYGDTTATIIPVLSSQTYTFSAKVKTNNAATNAVYMVVGQYTMAKVSAGAGASSTKLSGTNDWTTITGTITTSGTAERLYVYLYIGVAGNISDAWFDDISITLTNQVTRSSTDNNNQYASQPQFGLQPPYSLVLPPKAGGMSMSNTRGTGALSAGGFAGLGGTVTMAGTGVLEATGGLLAGLEVTMAGSGDLTAIGGGLLEAIVSMAGSGTLAGALSATAGMTVEMAGVGTVSFAPSGTGEMEVIIYVNQSQATVDQIVTGVTDSLGSITATVPNLLNTETGDVIIPLD